MPSYPTPSQRRRMLARARDLRAEHPGIEDWEVIQSMDQVLLDETTLPATECSDIASEVLSQADERTERQVA